MNDKYVTTDTFQAAVLMTLGFPVQLDTSEPKISFSFERTGEFEQGLSDYLSRAAQVEPFSLKSNMDYLYKAIYALRK